MEQEKTIKLENLRPEAYGVNYPMPDGFSIKAYNWRPAASGIRRIVEVPEYVFEYIKYDTSTLRDGYLVVVDADEDTKQEIENIIPEELKTFSVDDIKKLLNGDIKKLKKEVNEDTPKHILEDVIKVANEIKLDSSSKKKYLATLLGHESNVDFVFGEE